MKLVGGDSGRYEREELVDEVVLAPSERAVVDVLFESPGGLTLEHRTPERSYPLATIDVSDEPASRALAEQFEVLRTAPELLAERERLGEYLEAQPDKTLAFIAEMDFDAPAEGAVVYSCPMHPDVISEEPSRCAQCGMKLMMVNEMDSDHPMHHPFHVHGAGRFLILARNGEVEPNLVWSDTVLVRTGETVDILLDAAPRRRHLRARPVLPRSAVAVHQGLGAPGLGRG